MGSRHPKFGLVLLAGLLVAGCGWVRIESQQAYPQAGAASAPAQAEPSAQPQQAPAWEPARDAPPDRRIETAPIETQPLADPPPPTRTGTEPAAQRLDTTPVAEPAPRSAPAAPSSVASAAPASSGGEVVVQPGDTLFAISRREDVSVRDLMAENDLSPPYTLVPGQRLKLPAQQRVHTVQRGETLYALSRTYGVDVTSIARANDIPANQGIQTGQRLVIPHGGDSAILAQSPPAQAQETARVDVPTLTPAPAQVDRPQAEAATRPADPTPPAAEPEQPASTATARAAPPPLPSPPARAGGNFLKPVDGRILIGFGPQSGGLHNDGINIAAPRGTPIRAAENGVVVYAGDELAGFGNLVLIRHQGGWTTAYAHADRLLVERGQEVRRGQVIARVGSTGNVAEPQLHFELRRDNQAVDPAPHLGGSSA